MELFIAGGCGEHGRNCFYVEQNGLKANLHTNFKNRKKKRMRSRR